MPQKSPPAFLDYDQTTFNRAYDYAAYPPNCSRGPPPSAAIRRLLTQQLAPGEAHFARVFVLPHSKGTVRSPQFRLAIPA